MRILILTKRQTTHHDILDQRFGRSWHLPNELAGLGNTVHVVCLSYQTRATGQVLNFDTKNGGRLAFQSLNTGVLPPLGFLNYVQRIRSAIQQLHPDVIYAMSDPVYVIVGDRLTRPKAIPFFCDLQDNYETYASVRLPGVRHLFHRALKRADGVTCVSQLLSEKIASFNTNALTLNNGVDRDIFSHRDRMQCRLELGLPTNARLIGFAGTVDPQRGTDILFSGLRRLKPEFPDLQLALAGAAKGKIPRQNDIHYLGQLPHQKVPVFLNALDLAVICNKKSEFYDYTFPIKTYEILACGIPFIASHHVALRHLLKDHQDCLFQPDDLESFVRTARQQFREPNPPPIPILDWKELGGQLENFLKGNEK